MLKRSNARRTSSTRPSVARTVADHAAADESPMRVLMISDVYFPRVNGVSTSIQTFRHDLAALGCETWLVTPDYPQGWSDDERVLRQPSRYLAFDPEDRMMKSRATRAACMSFAGRVDVVHIQTPFVAHWVGLQGCTRAARPGGRDVPHVFRRVSASLLAAVARFHGARVRSHGVTPSMQRRRRGRCAITATGRRSLELRRHSPVRTIPTGLNLDEFAGGDGAAFRAATASRRTGP